MDGELFRSSRGGLDKTHKLEYQCLLQKDNHHQYEHQDDSSSSPSFRIPILQPFTTSSIFEETPKTETEIVPSPPPPPLLSSYSFSDFRPTDGRKKAGLHRCKTAPAMAVVRDLRQQQTQTQNPQLESNSIIRQAIFFLIIYLCLGVLIYSFNRDNFSGFETHAMVDALYFCIVTMCTIGYGDIAPLTPATKLFACAFVLVGFGFIGILLSGMVNYVVDLQENMILDSIRASTGAGGFSAKNYIFDAEKGRMRIRMKVALALGVVVLCIGTGTMIFYFVEHLGFVDSIYLSVMSVTTVGYGDKAFETLSGRIFACLWLLFSTLAVARAFLYLAEARIDKRHRRITNWVLQRSITVEDFLAADVNNHGFISKSDYVIYKLKEMGKIGEKDILQICTQFTKLDRNKSGKIKLPDILDCS
ncbi:two-pore potassium channel 5-like [Telopea speciosissima]|uniref:two-pore potassium channel 5-like n=1 Tax=Telopea speciosissima TaxID=54955 RepID=UPI001CC5E46A|nr:two-pore potassium channel 5-like [Telopea speciosissima]